MKKKLRDWMLEQDANAGSRLDALRRQTLEQRPTLVDIMLAVFQPAAAWATLAVVWIALLLTNRVVNRETAAPRLFGLDAATTTLASLLPNETSTPPDHHS